MTEILGSALLGLLIGGLWAVGELLLLARVIKLADMKAKLMLEDGADRQAVSRQTTSPVLKFFVSKYFLNVGLLAVVFILREALPGRWEYVLLFTGLGLTALFQALLMLSGLNLKLTFGLNK